MYWLKKLQRNMVMILKEGVNTTERIEIPYSRYNYIMDNYILVMRKLQQNTSKASHNKLHNFMEQSFQGSVRKLPTSSETPKTWEMKHIQSVPWGQYSAGRKMDWSFPFLSAMP